MSEGMSLRETLEAARGAVIEIDSIYKSIESINRRLYGISSPHLGSERGGGENYAKESAIDRKLKLEKSLEAARERAEALLDRAERCIELVKSPRKRAAMRYYYLCGAKSYEKVADLCGCSISSVKRWLA